VLFVSGFLWSQGKKVEQFPVFPSCENKFNEELESCFYDEVQQTVFTNFKVPQNVIDNNFKGNFIVLFEVNSEGKFIMQYSDAAYPELNEEIKRVFNEMEPIGPPTYAGNQRMQDILFASVFHCKILFRQNWLKKKQLKKVLPNLKSIKMNWMNMTISNMKNFQILSFKVI